MNTRSTNTLGYVHFGHSVIAGVDEGIGVALNPGSTGAAAIIEPISDSDTAALTIQAKGAAALTIGNSSNSVSIGGTPFAAYSTTFAYAFSALAEGGSEDFNIATTTADIQPGDLVTVSLGNVSTNITLAILNVRYSTAAASRVTVTVGNIGSTTFGSTGSGTGRVTWIDLT
jgi:hypothetical protein